MLAQVLLPIVMAGLMISLTGDGTPTGAKSGEGDKEGKSPTKSFYDFTVKDIDGDDVELSKYRGQVCLVVNVASR